MVYKIVSTDILPMRERQVHDPDEDKFLLILKSFIKSGPMYFSYSIDLTNSFQRQSQHDNSAPLWQRADERFFWNRFVQSDLIDFRTSGARSQPGPQPGADPYILPVIFGMLEIHPTTFKGTSLTIVLITRRSRHRGGTRYFSRGIDEEGHVSNYNETEQVVILNDNGSGLGGFTGGNNIQTQKAEGRETQILSYVQTRGSVPVYWAEINTLSYTPKLQIRGIDTATPAAAAHFNEQVRIYGDNYLVNLVNQKGREMRVKEAYEQIVQKLQSSPKDSITSDQITDEKFHVIESGSSSKQTLDRIHYIYFDFHSETKGMKLHRAQLLLDRMQDALIAQQYFRAVDMPASIDGRLEVRNYQTSVVRTNCMDCLDRTNVVQSMLARWTLDRIFVDLGLMQRGATFKDEDPAFEFMFRNLWADNADVVSNSYSGTGAMKTDMTRLGIRTKRGALRDGQIAVTRYVKNNFLDGPRQDAFDLFLGTYRPGEATIGGNFVFADRRPVLIQSIPYVLAFSIFFVLVGLLTKRLPDSAVMPMRLFIVFWTLVGVWSARFILKNGMLYVSTIYNTCHRKLTGADNPHRSTGQNLTHAPTSQKATRTQSARSGRIRSSAPWWQDTNAGLVRRGTSTRKRARRGLSRDIHIPEVFCINKFNLFFSAGVRVVCVSAFSFNTIIHGPATCGICFLRKYPFSLSEILSLGCLASPFWYLGCGMIGIDLPAIVSSSSTVP